MSDGTRVALAMGALLIVGLIGFLQYSSEQSNEPPRRRKLDAARRLDSPPAAPLFDPEQKRDFVPSPALAVPASAIDDWESMRDAIERSLPVASSGPRPRSLRGSDIDGELRVDADGHFVPDPRALALMDYFFAASGEEPLDVIRGRIVREILARLEFPAAQEAIHVLDRYIAYRQAARDLLSGEAAPHDLERRLQWMRELRREVLGPELSTAFYGEQERVAQLDVERHALAQDSSLSKSERAARLADNEEQLPEHIREARRRVAGPTRLHQRVEVLRDEGATREEIFELRAEQFGQDAAERLAALDAQRADWKRRLSAYGAERERLGGSLGSEERNERLAALRSSYFDESELARVMALEGAGLLDSGR